MKPRKAKRFDQAIKPITRVNYPTRFIFFDTETIPQIQEDGKSRQILKVGVAKYIIRDKNQKHKKEEEFIFYTNTEFFDWVESLLEQKQKIILYAHNIAFDLMVLDTFNYYKNKGIDIKPPIQSGMRFLWKVPHPKGKIEFVNTGNYVPFSLELIGKDLGFPKLDVDFENATMSELITYCQRDVEIIKQFIFKLIDFLQDNDLGGLKSTIASQALNTYRYRFMNQPIVLHNNLYVNTIERDAYTGGRTECFYIGKVPVENIYGLDINSMYPYVMKQGFLPSEFNSIVAEQNPKYILEMMEHNYIIAEVLLNTNKNFYGIKWNENKYRITNSDKSPKGRKLIFPTGTFRAYLHHDELKYAIDHGFIIHVYNLILYKPRNLFNEYVDFFTDVKVNASEQANKTDRLMAKLFLNSLYGKFGQKFHDMKILVRNIHTGLGVQNVINTVTGEHWTDFQWFDDLWREYTNGESSFSFPAIAGAITARARMLLYDYMERVERHNVYYCDTDSIYTNETGYLRLLSECHPTKLGAMALEKKFSNLTVNGAKDYKINNTRIVKGVPKNAMWLNDNVSLSTRFEGWKEYRNNGMDRPPLVWQQLKIKTLEYDKGIRQDDGYVKPYNIVDNYLVK